MIRFVAPLAALLLAAVVPMPTSAAEAGTSAVAGEQLAQGPQGAQNTTRRRARRARRTTRRARRPRRTQQSQVIVVRPAEIG